MRGKNINLFLMDGTVTGIIRCHLSNWTGVAYKIPRIQLGNCKDRPELKQSGVYFLFGKSEETGDDVVYIGQAGVRKNGEGTLNRIQEHNRNSEKDYWTEAVVFTTSNNSFGSTEISYLENRFTKIAIEAKRYRVTNGNEPTSGHTTEEKASELEEFIDYAMVIMGTLGFKVFIPINDTLLINTVPTQSTNIEPTVSLNRNNTNANGKRTNDGFIVLKGSKISATATKSCPESAKKLREANADKIDDNFTLTEDIQFTSPSSAAAFVLQASANGLIEWKDENGVSLKILEQNITTE